MKTIVIELFGLPASGKSTIANAVIKKLRNIGFKVDIPTYQLKNEMSRQQRILWKIRYGIKKGLRSPLQTLHQTKLIHDSRQQTIQDMMKNMYNFMYVCGLTHEYKSQEGLTIVDQGLIQALWSIDLSSRYQSREKLKQLAISALSSVENRIVIVVQCNRSTIERRLANRKINASRVSLDARSMYSLDRAFDSMERTLDVLSECSSEFDNVIKLNNNKNSDISNSVSTIIEQIK